MLDDEKGEGRQRHHHQQQQQDEAGRGRPRSLQLLELPEDALVAFLLAAGSQKGHTLRALSCSCTLLNSVARTRTPFTLHLVPKGYFYYKREALQYVLQQARALATRGPPFSGCTSLTTAAGHAASYAMLPSILAPPAGWPNLVELFLDLWLPAVPHDPPQHLLEEEQQQHVEEEEEQPVEQQQQQEEEEVVEGAGEGGPDQAGATEGPDLETSNNSSSRSRSSSRGRSSSRSRSRSWSSRSRSNSRRSSSSRRRRSRSWSSRSNSRSRSHSIEQGAAEVAGQGGQQQQQPPPVQQVQHHQQQQEAGAGAPELRLVRYLNFPSKYAAQDLMTAGPVLCLRHMPQLRRLTLEVGAFGSQSARSLAAAAPHLTKLVLIGVDTRMTAPGQKPWCNPPSDMSPLTGLTALQQLVVHGSLCAAPALGQQRQDGSTSAASWPSIATSSSNRSSSSSNRSSSRSSCLPSSLLDLQLHCPPLPAYWLTHLGGCPRLKALYLESVGDLKHDTTRSVLGHPAAVVAAARQHTPGLTSLRLVGYDPEPRWIPDPCLPQAAGGGGAAAAAEPVPKQWRSRGDLVALTGLQQLRSDVAVPLVVANAGDWEGLARLEHLTEIEVIHIRCKPPPTLQPLPLVHLLRAQLDLSGAGTRQLLAVLPRLQQLSFELLEEKGQEGAGGQAADWAPKSTPGPPPHLPALTRLEASYHRHVAAPQEAAHAAAQAVQAAPAAAQAAEAAAQAAEAAAQAAQAAAHAAAQAVQAAPAAAQAAQAAQTAAQAAHAAQTASQAAAQAVQAAPAAAQAAQAARAAAQAVQVAEAAAQAAQVAEAAAAFINCFHGATGLQELHLTWPACQGGHLYLPDLGPFSRLQQLGVGLPVGHAEAGVVREEVLEMLHPVAGTLRELSLSLPSASHIKEGLEAALPALTKLDLYG